MSEGVCQCGVEVVRGEDGDFVHDATLAELRVTAAEVERVRENALINHSLPRGSRRYNALHQVKLWPKRAWPKEQEA